MNKLRKHRDGDDYTELKPGDPTPQNEAAANSPSQMTSRDEEEADPTALHEELGCPERETVRKQVVNNTFLLHA